MLILQNTNGMCFLIRNPKVSFDFFRIEDLHASYEKSQKVSREVLPDHLLPLALIFWNGIEMFLPVF